MFNLSFVNSILSWSFLENNLILTFSPNYIRADTPKSQNRQLFGDFTGWEFRILSIDFLTFSACPSPFKVLGSYDRDL
ncbi:hypothetical protein CKA32_001167 [Geitlerinema sp. FC II]|nr:hypothetical protein CKA32_001167 [Geitlerinema sp. FC II]